MLSTKSIFVLLPISALIASCENAESQANEEKSRITKEFWKQQESDRKADDALRMKALEQRVMGSPLAVSHSEFKADKNLNAYLPFTITNKANKTVIGFYLLQIGNGADTKLGKFKKTIKPGKSVVVRVSAAKLGVSSEEAMKNPDFQYSVDLYSYVATPVFADGTSSYGYPIRPIIGR
ncbi:hypothetical protein [Hymenobacter properus]|uniref:Lipoprotein n=1 Tax=Hymenobacter properus TaxID=2791026 RepID=A0A931BFC9_9BACT|nr:hypothetical protein [Hymenobacter properus]MBF9142880.1 hypothetical protein [Hymenobacter properus]MBR7721687.1 hypothetical protein [Microvirga sp. SRT04]